MKHLANPELHAISKASAILRSISFPFLFHTVRIHVGDSPGLQHLAQAYFNKEAVCKIITELRLDHFQVVENSGWNVDISHAVASFFREILRNPISCLTTLVLHEVMIVDTLIHPILKSQTLRRLYFHACWCDKLIKPFPRTKIREFITRDLTHGEGLEAIVAFLAPQLELLEHYGFTAGFPPTNQSMPTLFPTRCPQLKRYVLRLVTEGNEILISRLREFLTYATTIEDLELGIPFPSNTFPLPPSALPNLRVYDITLSTGFPATQFITGPRRKLALLRIRDDFVRSHDLDSVRNFLDFPYEVSELHLTFRQYIITELLPAQLGRGLPDIERLYLNIKANHLCLLPRGDFGLCRNCAVLDSILIGVSEFVNCVKAPYPIQEDENDCSRSPCLHKVKTIDVDIDVDSIGLTSPHALDEWFHGVITVNCPVLKEVYFRIWKANDQGVEEDRAGLGPRFWSRWHVGVDEHWCYKWGFYFGT